LRREAFSAGGGGGGGDPCRLGGKAKEHQAQMSSPGENNLIPKEGLSSSPNFIRGVNKGGRKKGVRKHADDPAIFHIKGLKKSDVTSSVGGDLRS